MILQGSITVTQGDSREVLKGYPDNHFDSVVTDPPYALVSITKRFGKAGSAPAKGNAAYTRASAGFMGQQWDTGETAFDPEFWAEVMRVLKPGGHVAAFSGTRTYHRMACAIEDAGFEIRDQLAWTYGSGFPKSHDVSKGIDKAAGLTREVIRERYTAKRIKPGATVVAEGAYGKQDISFTATDTAPASEDSAKWQGWGTALKPAWEPICLGRKPMGCTVAENVMAHGTGAINIADCRVGSEGGTSKAASKAATISVGGYLNAKAGAPIDSGRWPANIIHDGSAEVVALFPESASSASSDEPNFKNQVYGRGMGGTVSPGNQYSDAGSAARFFYTAKADASDRIGSKHPTVKPVDLMQWLVRLITPPGGLVLEPFAGSGTTGEAAFREGMRCVMIEREAGFVADIERRIGLLLAGPEERARSGIKAKIADGRIKDDAGPLFAGPEIAPTDRPTDRQNTTVTRANSTSARPHNRPGRAQAVNE